MTEADAEIVWHHACRMRRRAPVSLGHQEWAAASPREAQDCGLSGLRAVLADFRSQRDRLLRVRASIPSGSPVWMWYGAQILDRERVIAAREAMIAEVERDGMPPWPRSLR